MNNEIYIWREHFPNLSDEERFEIMTDQVDYAFEAADQLQLLEI